MDKIPNSHLIEKDIPSHRASWKKIEPFALTFDGYKHWGSFKRCREVAEVGVTFYREKKQLTQSLTDLRTGAKSEIKVGPDGGARFAIPQPADFRLYRYELTNDAAGEAKP